MPLNDRQWSGLARDLRRAVARVAPDWTDSGAHDPGITVLELLAFTLDDLHHRAAASNPHGLLLARRVADRAAALATAFGGAAAENDDCGSGLQRVNYLSGMLLGVDDFRAEQEYVRERVKRRNRVLGAGIVSGLAVTVEGNAGQAQVVIAPGLAVDPAGEEIFIATPCALALPAAGSALLVALAYRERPCRSVATAAGAPLDTDAAPAPGPTRIVETFAASLASAAGADAVIVARVRRVRGRWRVDASFEAPCVPCR